MINAERAPLWVAAEHPFCFLLRVLCVSAVNLLSLHVIGSNVAEKCGNAGGASTMR